MFQKIIIQQNRSKLFFGSFGSFCFFILGVYIVIASEKFASESISSFTIGSIGWVMVVVFGWIALSQFFKLWKNEPGLIIDGVGITDYSSGIFLGRIPWTEIISVRLEKVVTQKLIVLEVIHPERYLEKATNFVDRNNLKYNMEQFGTPVLITSSGLHTNINSLFKVISKATDKHQYN